MAKKTAEDMNRERGATKQRRKGRSKSDRNGSMLAEPFRFTKGDFDHDRKEQERAERARKQQEWEEKQKRRRAKAAREFGRAVNEEINRLLDLIDSAGTRGVNVAAEAVMVEPLRAQVLAELTGWLDQNANCYSYTPHGDALYVAKF